MNRIAFIDIEVEPTNGTIQDIGCVKNDGSLFHRNSLAAFAQCIAGAQFVCGHNIINHDLNYVGQTLSDAGIKPGAVIDTLFLSPLLFPSKPYHALLKDDKLQYDEANNPLNDAIKAKDLFYDEIASFNQLDEGFKEVCYLLLHNKLGFGAFFDFLNYKIPVTSAEVRIRERFGELICEKADLHQLITDQPVALAYCLALIHANSRYSITPRWVIKNYPEVERIMFRLRNQPCLTGCSYCNQMLDAHGGLKKYFGFDAFRTYGGEPLQEKAVKAAIKRNLTIHVNADFLESMTAENLEKVMDRNHYPPPEELAMHLTYQDVWLDYFINKQHFVSQLVSGDNLIVSGNECLMPNGQSVLKFSKKFLDQIAAKRKTGYELKAAKVNFVLHWRKEGAEQEVKVVLPEVLFERT